MGNRVGVQLGNEAVGVAERLHHLDHATAIETASVAAFFQELNTNVRGVFGLEQLAEDGMGRIVRMIDNDMQVVSWIVLHEQAADAVAQERIVAAKTEDDGDFRRLVVGYQSPLPVPEHEDKPQHKQSLAENQRHQDTEK